MKQNNPSAGDSGKFIRAALVFVALAIYLLPSEAQARQTASPKRLLVLYWYEREYAGNITFERNFRSILQSQPAGTVEYYNEYLESNRFPGENQELLLRNYLREKYADRRIDVIIAVTDRPLEFLLKYRHELFTNTPIVFTTVKTPTPTDLATGPGMTGIVYGGNQRSTLDMALRLHPDTEQVFIVSGTPEHDKRFEIPCRKDLEGYESKATITYLTDLPLGELLAKTGSLPQRSLILYLWQQAQNEEGRTLESPEVAALIARSSPVPVYGLTSPVLGTGIIGGNVRMPERIATRAAEIALKIADGMRPQDIPLENASTVPMFDWRQIRRWGISEENLPPGSIIEFRQPSFWEQFKWYAIGAISLFILQAALIAGLIINRTQRKRTEAMLRETKESLTIALDAAQMGSWDLDLVNDFSGHRSLRHDQIFGYDLPPAEWGREIARRHIVEEDREMFDAAFARASETGHLKFEARVRWPDGSIHWMAARGRFYADENGRFTRGAGVNADITERRQAEEALRESEARFRALFNEAGTGISLLDLSAEEPIHSNRALQSMLGCSEDELGRLETFHALTHPDEREGDARLHQELREGKRDLIRQEKHFLLRNGSHVWANVIFTLLRDAKGCPRYVIGMHEDITEGKQAEEALRESEERFRNMANQAPVVVWVTEADGSTTFLSQTWRKFTGQAPEAGLGFGWLECVHPDDRERTHEIFLAANERHEPFRLDYRLRGRDGEYRWAIDSAAPRFGSQGNFMGYIGSVIDITEQKDAERALMELSGQLIRAREDECARIARELHDDLNQRVALVSLDLDQLRINPPQSETLWLTAVERMLQQATELSSEIHRMSHDLHPSKLAHLGLVAALKGLCGELSRGYGLSIAFRNADVPAGLSKEISICLYRIAQESLHNVIKHSGAKAVEVELLSVEQEIRLRITDSGSGFDADSASSKKGLGLISMRERLRLVGGTISIESAIRQGTTILASVPLGRVGVRPAGIPEGPGLSDNEQASTSG